LTAELQNLYQEMILDHQRHPRNFRAIAQPDRTARGYNPLCGDQVTVYLRLSGDVVCDVSFEGVGCAICTASASLMTEHVKGKSVQEIESLFDAFHTLMTDGREEAEPLDVPGKLRVFEGVRRFPIRVKCATLPWHTLRAALQGNGEMVSTE
jgi:nitrogen fixation NifU-like protein